MLAHLRPLLRKISAWIASLVLLPLILAPLGQFLTEIAQENGLYNNPSNRVGAIMRALSDFVLQSWVLILAAFLVGLTIGLWADYLLRRIERLTSSDESALSDSDYSNEPMGMLDNITIICARLEKLHEFMLS
jgi:hypothetical protein